MNCSSQARQNRPSHGLSHPLPSPAHPTSQVSAQSRRISVCLSLQTLSLRYHHYLLGLLKSLLTGPPSRHLEHPPAKSRVTAFKLEIWSCLHHPLPSPPPSAPRMEILASFFHLFPYRLPLSPLLPHLPGCCSPLTWELPHAHFHSHAPLHIQSMRSSLRDTASDLGCLVACPGSPGPVQPSPGFHLYNQQRHCFCLSHQLAASPKRVFVPLSLPRA